MGIIVRFFLLTLLGGLFGQKPNTGFGETFVASASQTMTATGTTIAEFQPNNDFDTFMKNGQLNNVNTRQYYSANRKGPQAGSAQGGGLFETTQRSSINVTESAETTAAAVIKNELQEGIMSTPKNCTIQTNVFNSTLIQKKIEIPSGNLSTISEPGAIDSSADNHLYGVGDTASKQEIISPHSSTTAEKSSSNLSATVSSLISSDSSASTVCEAAAPQFEIYRQEVNGTLAQCDFAINFFKQVCETSFL